MNASLVEEQLRCGNLVDSPVSHNASAKRHAGRIAYFVVHGWTDPISIDVGVPELRCHVAWPVQDGNHRLAAAAIRKDATIDAHISGSVKYASALLSLEAGGDGV